MMNAAKIIRFLVIKTVAFISEYNDLKFSSK
ncbi:MAG: hypothetical protein RJB31_1708 [Bacteroidota bacterium]